MQGKKSSRLTSSEIAVIWSSYQNNSFSACVMKYFLNNVDDPETKSILKLALDISEKNMKGSKEIFEKGDQPVPVGFTDEDVSPDAPRLFSDAFYLYYIKNMSKVGLAVYGVALCTSAKSEVREFLSQAVQSSTDLYNQTADILLSKGLFVRPPFVSTANHVDFVDEKKYLGGLFKHDRPLNTVEITHLTANIEANEVGGALLTGLAQVARSKKVRDFCRRGKEISKKHVNLLSTTLTRDDIPAPLAWDIEVTDSTVSPFSDKLMMFHTTLLVSSSISNYATASAASLRMDVASAYARLSTEIAQYAKDGVDLMIEKGWLEQPPQAPDHKGLNKG